MPHVPIALLAGWRRAVICAVLVGGIACSHESGELRVVVSDSTMRRDAVEVLALPFDPASLGVAPRSVPRSPADALADSAASLDARFQSERRAINAQALALHSADRRSSGYAASFDSLSRRRNAAEQLRGARDAARRRSAGVAGSSLAGRTTTRPVSATPAGEAQRTWRERIESAARYTRRPIVRAPLEEGGTVLTLPAAEWWIVLARRDGTFAGRAVGREVRAGGRDTVHIPVIR